eukprot:4562051-Amphidinium_carterae.1
MRGLTGVCSMWMAVLVHVRVLISLMLGTFPALSQMICRCLAFSALREWHRCAANGHGAQAACCAAELWLPNKRHCNALKDAARS